MKAFLKDLFQVGVSRGVVLFSGILTTIVTARWLDPEKNGIIASLLVYPGLFISIGSLGIQQSTTYFMGKGVYDERDIKKAVAQIWIFSSVFSLVTCYLLITFFTSSGDNTLYVIMALLQIPFTLFTTYNAGFFLGKNEIAKFNRINWVPGVITLLLTAVLLIVFHMGIMGYLIAMIGGPLFMFALLIPRNKLVDAISLDVNWVIVKGLLRLGLTYAIALFVINLNYRFDVIMLERLGTKQELGIYTKGANFIQALWQIPMLLSTIVFVRSAVSKNDAGFSLKVAQLLRLSFIFIGFAALILVVFSDLIVSLLFGSQFAGSAPVLRLLAPGVLLLTIFKVMNMDLAGKGRPSTSLWAMVPGLVINVLCNLYLIPRYGAVGAAISSTISYSILALLFLHFYSKTVNVPIKTILTYRKSDFAVFGQLLNKIKK
ncbi:MAG TPA: polysaccharide biosynthesis C-terminal domain-containing protein [Flavobacterium sp.]|nr:polysaccharide biosynthesis C-terminal domain-containing protein [Flavobacterium sp.]